MTQKEKKINNEQTLSEKLDEIVELKKHENSALKKIFNSLQKPKENKNEKH